MIKFILAAAFLTGGIGGLEQAAAPAQSPEMEAMLQRMLKQNVFVLHGTCSRLMTPDGDQTSSCGSDLTNMAFSSGNSSFIATVTDKGSVSFRGRDSAAQGDLATIKLDTIILTGADVSNITSIKARGQCTYTNPNKWPVRVECEASTPRGKYELSFVSDGVWPPK